MKKQNWIKKGLIFGPPKTDWGLTHCMLPTPIRLNKKTIRLFYATRNRQNISSITFQDLDISDGIKLINKKKVISFEKGKLGHFDDNGVLPSSIIKKGKFFYLYYIGWQPRLTTRYSLIAGLSISKNGKVFKRFSESPILKNNNKEPISILTAPCVLKVKKNFYMWYVSGIKWKHKDYPLYDIKFAKSKNGIDWTQTGKSCLKLKKKERALARPYVLFKKNKFHMWYSYEIEVGNYKIGYATSNNGIKWERKDKKINLNYKSKYEINMREYPALIEINNKLLMFYNGDNYGKEGILFSELNDHIF